jgi:hypothetical protein
VTTTSVVYYSLDGSRGMIVSEVNLTTSSFRGVYTPSNGTPVIGNTSVLISAPGADPSLTNYGIASVINPVSSDIFLGQSAWRANGAAPSESQGGSRVATLRVNTSGIITVGTITSYTVANGPFVAFNFFGSQFNTTTYFAKNNTYSTNCRILALSTNLTTISILSTNQSGINFAVGGYFYNYASVGDTYYYPTNSSVVFSTLNATTRLVSVPVTQSINTNFYLSTATWYKVSDTRWLADYQNATTLAREIATFDVNSTTLAFSSINSTSRLYSGMVRFIGTTSAITNVSTALTTAVLDYASGLGYNINTLELSTNGQIKGYNTGTYLGIPSVEPYDYNFDPDTSNQIVTAFVNTSMQYKNLIVNAASTDQFNYAGIATANDSTSPVTVIQDGIQDGYTGLLIGSIYYVNFDGTLTTVATNITAGVAVTSTQLQVRQVSI